MEGLRDVYWKGDKIVWENLIINYIKSLERVFALTILLNEDKKVTDDDIIVSSGLLNFSSPKREILVKEIISKNFKIKFISKLPIGFAKRLTPIRRAELLSYLQIIHPFVLNSISETYYKHKLTYKPKFHQNLDEFENVLEKFGNLPEIIK